MTHFSPEIPFRRRNGRQTGVGLGLAVALLAALPGCADRPLASPEPVDHTPPRIVAGPYADGAGPYGPDRVTLRFLTNRPAVPGVRRRDARVKIVERAGHLNEQRLTVAFLQQNDTDPVRLLLDNVEGPDLPLRGVAGAGQPARLLFTERPARWDAFGWRTVESLADGVVVLGAPVPGAADAEALQRDFFAPLGAAAWFAPYHFAPGVTNGYPARLFASGGGAESADFWVRDVGAVRLVGFDVDAVDDPARLEALVRQLRALNSRPTNYPSWTVGVASKPLVDADGAHAARVRLLANELENAGVDWVVSGGGRFGYARSAAFTGDDGAHTTRYVAFAPADSASGGEASARADYIASTGRATSALLEADGERLVWTALDAEGQPVDRVEAARRGRAPDATPRAVLEDEASILLAHRREVERIVRQLPRRVPDPNRPPVLSLWAENPTDRPLDLEFVWDDDGGRGEYRIEPATLSVHLEPWQGGQIPFGVQRGGGNQPRRLTVRAGRAGTATDTLIVRPEQWYAIPQVARRVNVNGRLDEEAWNLLRMNPITDFVRLSDGGAPGRATRAAMAADERGLIVAFQCDADNPFGLPARADRPQDFHDHPDVLRDEGVEIWIAPDRTGRSWYRFAANRYKVRYESSSSHGTGFNPEWEMNNTVPENKRIDYEIRIPWSVFGLEGPPPVGTEWGVNLVRNDIEPVLDALARKDASASAVSSTWARVEGDLARGGLFNLVRFTGRVP